MVSKDRGIGGVIFTICLVIAFLFVLTLFYPDWVVHIGWASSPDPIRFWIVAVPVFIAFIAILGIGMWIGWTMATTPPPKPIEEITRELEEEEEAPEEVQAEEKSKEEAEE